MQANKSRDRERTKPTLNSTEAGAAHPALPAVLLLVSFAVFMAAIAPLNFSAMWAKFFPGSVRSATSPDAVVWVDYSAGVYYCADSMMFGKSKGEYEEQGKALDRGYQPALGTFCSGPKWTVPPHQARPASTASTSSPKPTPAVQATDPGEPSPFDKPAAKSTSQPSRQIP